MCDSVYNACFDLRNNIHILTHWLRKLIHCFTFDFSYNLSRDQFQQYSICLGWIWLKVPSLQENGKVNRIFFILAWDFSHPIVDWKSCQHSGTGSRLLEIRTFYSSTSEYHPFQLPNLTLLNSILIIEDYHCFVCFRIYK